MSTEHDSDHTHPEEVETAPSDTAIPEAPPEPLPGESVVRQRPRPDVEWVEVDGEVVAWNAEAESLHLLDPVAGLAFMLADGTATLRQTAEELADAHGQPVDVVEAPVLAAAAQLENLGLVEVVR